MENTKNNISLNYELYTKLCHDKKIVKDSKIVLSPKVNKKDSQLGTTVIIHNICEYDVEFIIEKSVVSLKYWIKLKSKNLGNAPYFRFDSDGPAHRNADSTLSILNQVVHTPHFNSFDKHGRSIAYQNDILKSPKEAKAIQNNIDFGIALFCQESNTRTHDDNFPSVESKNLLLDLDSEIIPTILTDNIDFE